MSPPPIQLTPASEAADTPGTALATQQIGLARLITDRVTFAYLTDVYVLPGHQGKGLGRWLLSCVGQHVAASCPRLRGFVLFTHGERAVRFYEAVLGMLPQTDAACQVHNLVLMHRAGPAAQSKTAEKEEPAAAPAEDGR